MGVHKLYIMQTSFNGMTYTKGTPIDTLAKFGVVVRDIPFKLYSDTKEVVTKNWKGSHGLDAYIPNENKVKDYDIEVQCLYVGTHQDMRTNIEAFLKFLNGKAVTGITATGARLAIYDEYTQIGRKDVKYMTSDFGTWWDLPDYDTDAIADFKVILHVYDPMTDVSPSFDALTGNIEDLTWT